MSTLPGPQSLSENRRLHNVPTSCSQLPRVGPLRTSNFRRDVWAPACEASGMPDGLLVHDLRDTAASLVIATSASIKAVQRMLGHASAAMTLDTYGSLFEDDLEALADRLQDAYSQADSQSAAIPESAQGGYKTARIVRFPR